MECLGIWMKITTLKKNHILKGNEHQLHAQAARCCYIQAKAPRHAAHS